MRLVQRTDPGGCEIASGVLQGPLPDGALEVAPAVRASQPDAKHNETRQQAFER